MERLSRLGTVRPDGQSRAVARCLEEAPFVDDPGPSHHRLFLARDTGDGSASISVEYMTWEGAA